MALSILTENEQNGDIEFQHSLLCTLAFPRSEQNSREYVHEQGGRILKLSAGDLYIASEGRMVPQPLPYGPKARMGFAHICGEALRSNDPAVELERSGRKFMSRMGIPDGGTAYDMMRLQMNAIAAVRMVLGYTGTDGRSNTVDMKPIHAFSAWEPQKDGGLWPSAIQLSVEFFDDLKKHAVPLSTNALRGLSGSALALDWYGFFAYRLHSLEKPLFLSWRALHAQMGHGYATAKDFRKRSLLALKAVLQVYPSANVEQVPGGLMLKPSPSPVARRAVGVLPSRADKVRASLPADPPAKPNQAHQTPVRHLNPHTIERFRRLYPSLDPYVCEDDFRYWLDTYPSAKQPHSYDAAFLGFAKKWAEKAKKAKV